MEESKKKSRIPWAIAWALSVVLAFILGAQSGTFTGSATTPPAATNQAGEHPSQGANDALPQPQTDAKVIELMKSLPARKAEDPMSKGKQTAPVVMLMWSDYRCPFCSLFSRQTLPQLAKYVESGQLRIEYRDLPMFGEQSSNAAYAGRAAGMQGKFWQFHDVVAKHAPESGHPDIDDAKLLAYAKEAGVGDINKFNADRTSAAVRQAVEQDANQARELGIRGTPFFIVNTTVISGAQPADVFTAVIEREAKR